MIKIQTLDGKFEHVLKPTIFPDQTSQVWKLPEQIIGEPHLKITWNFEAEREVLDLLSLTKILNPSFYALQLHMPYLPYARQDKIISNTSTFNLAVLCDLLNSMDFSSITAVDAHNPNRTLALLHRFVNIDPISFQLEAIKHSEPNYLVFPDAGAQARYSWTLRETKLPVIVCDKDRDQLTGEIRGHKVISGGVDPVFFNKIKFLIVDDLCDGGATFISVAKLLRGNLTNRVDLCVTHGIFSRGRVHLYDNGISQIFTTNSLLKNEDGYKV